MLMTLSGLGLVLKTLPAGADCPVCGSSERDAPADASHAAPFRGL